MSIHPSMLLFLSFFPFPNDSFNKDPDRQHVYVSEHQCVRGHRLSIHAQTVHRPVSALQERAARWQPEFGWQPKQTYARTEHEVQSRWTRTAEDEPKTDAIQRRPADDVAAERRREQHEHRLHLQVTRTIPERDFLEWPLDETFTHSIETRIIRFSVVSCK